MGIQLSICKNCGAQVIWAVTAKGIKVLVDALPDAEGTIRVDAPQVSTESPLATIYTVAAPPGTSLHRSHFLTCVNVKRRRRRA